MKDNLNRIGQNTFNPFENFDSSKLVTVLNEIFPTGIEPISSEDKANIKSLLQVEISELLELARKVYIEKTHSFVIRNTKEFKKRKFKHK